MPSTDNTVAIVAIAVSGGVALVAAVVAPVTAHFRQKSLLSDEGDRLDRQLAHDREMKDLSELRDRLDEVVDIGEAALSAICEARLRWVSDDEVGRLNQLTKATECLGQMGFKERRVMLRTGTQNELISCLAGYHFQLQSMFDLLNRAIEDGEKVPTTDWTKAINKVAKGQVAVVGAGSELLGTEIRAFQKD